MAEERVISLPPRARALQSFVLTSVVAFRESGAGWGWAHAGQPAEEWSWGTRVPGACCIEDDLAGHLPYDHKEAE